MLSPAGIIVSATAERISCSALENVEGWEARVSRLHPSAQEGSATRPADAAIKVFSVSLRFIDFTDIFFIRNRSKIDKFSMRIRSNLMNGQLRSCVYQIFQFASAGNAYAT